MLEVAAGERLPGRNPRVRAGRARSRSAPGAGPAIASNSRTSRAVIAVRHFWTLPARIGFRRFASFRWSVGYAAAVRWNASMSGSNSSPRNAQTRRSSSSGRSTRSSYRTGRKRVSPSVGLRRLRRRQVFHPARGQMVDVLGPEVRRAIGEGDIPAVADQMDDLQVGEAFQDRSPPQRVLRRLLAPPRLALPPGPHAQQGLPRCRGSRRGVIAARVSLQRRRRVPLADVVRAENLAPPAGHGPAAGPCDAPRTIGYTLL